MKILLVNDDGYLHPNILALEEILSKYGHVYVVAPSTGMSGAGCGLNTFRDMRFYKVDEFHYHVDGTPVDCVQFADYLIGDVDLVVSGVNQGFNLSNDIMYSGTCGGAFQSLMFRRKAIALSAHPQETLDNIKKYAELAIDYIIEHDIASTDYFLNVNFPDNSCTENKGFYYTSLFIRRSTYTLETLNEEDHLYHLHRHHDDNLAPKGTDVWAVNNGYISICPMGVSCYKDTYLKDLKKRANR